MVYYNKKDIIKELHILEKQLKRRPTKRDNSNLYRLSRKHFGSWNKMMNEAGYFIKEKQKSKIPNLNCDLLYYFLGLLSTDGHIVLDIKNESYKVLIFTSNKEEKEMIIKLIKVLFDYEASIREKNYGFSNNKNYEIYISSKDLVIFLTQELHFPFGAKSLTIQIPEFIKNCNNGRKWQFIRGIIDGDGSIIKTEKSSCLKIPSGSQKFIADLENLFRNLGFDSGKIRQERGNLWVMRFGKVEDIKRMYPLVYADTRSYFYKRKHNIWKQYV